MLNRDSCNLEKVYSDYEVLWIAVVLFQSIPTLLQSSANVLYAGNIELEVCLSVRLCVCVTEGGGQLGVFPLERIDTCSHPAGSQLGFWEVYLQTVKNQKLCVSPSHPLNGPTKTLATETIFK